MVYFSGSIELRVDTHNRITRLDVDALRMIPASLPGDFDVRRLGGEGHEVTHRRILTGRQHKHTRLRSLQHAPHPVDIFPGKAPIALGVYVAEFKNPSFAELDARKAIADFPRDEFQTA